MISARNGRGGTPVCGTVLTPFRGDLFAVFRRGDALQLPEGARDVLDVGEAQLGGRLLETRFKKSMGTSIYDYIIQTRIEKMMQLLCEGLSVSEAAAELGFSDIKNVSRTFRQLKGLTPSEYRSQVAPKRR